MKRLLFTVAVFALLLTTAVLLYPRTNGPWTGYLQTSQGKYVADSSHLTLQECRRYVQSHAGGMCGFDCGVGTQCRQTVPVPELARP